MFWSHVIGIVRVGLFTLQSFFFQSCISHPYYIYRLTKIPSGGFRMGAEGTFAAHLIPKQIRE